MVMRKISDIINFYPRPPRGGRLAALCTVRDELEISIHALREEGDDAGKTHATRQSDDAISIHALREEGDLSRIGGKTETGKFLSTPSARRATWDSRKRSS